MAKDPAFLFYSGDFLTGTTFMSNEETGQYIKILCLLHQHNGKLPRSKIEKAVGRLTDLVLEKLQIDKDNNLFNKRLMEETIKRNAYCSSRRKNILHRYKKSTYVKHMNKHMENENEDRNRDINVIDKVIDKGVVKSGHFEEFWAAYPRQVGMQMALITYLATIKTDKDFENLMLALKNYKASKDVKGGFIMNGDKWIEDWRGWLGQKPKSAMLAKFEVKT